ncbi:MAG: methyltransferase domain-containing protein [Bacteroidetes bacterium]|nr:MAG: methyltransferase domain-containing protein [Bacteroidota bacterium]
MPDADFWQDRYEQGYTGWDLGAPSPPLQAFIDQLDDPSVDILIPGAGNAHEAAYLHRRGFRRVRVLDFVDLPLQRLARRFPDFPPDHLIQGDFFAHQGQYDLILEQTFFCALDPDRRADYARHMAQLLRPGGRLVGVWFTFPLRSGQDRPPYGGSPEEYAGYFEADFTARHFARCYNSHPSREGQEWFMSWERRSW